MFSDIFTLQHNLPFTSSEREPDYYHQNVSIRYSSQAAELLTDSRKLGNFKEIPEVLGIDGKVLRWSLEKQVFTAVLENCERSAVKHFIEKIIVT